MLFSQLARRRLEAFHFVTALGVLILLTKIGYESVSWSHLSSFVPNIDLSAGNATLGVSGRCPIASLLN